MDMIGFIGMGNMGTAMLKGAKRTFDGSQIIFLRKSVDKMKKLAEEEKVNYAMSNSEVAEKSKYIILAIKPQMFEKVIDEINDSLDYDKVIISLAPGFTITQFKEKLKARALKEEISLSPKQLDQFELFYNMLIETNKSMNLTAITDEDEVIEKHFIDSLSCRRVMDMTKVKTCIDVGTGAGFPGIPLKIVYPEIQFVLVDSLYKRVSFLNEV